MMNIKCGTLKRRIYHPIREKRRSKNMKLSELSILSGVGVKRLSEIERMRVKPTPDEVEKMDIALKGAVEWIASGSIIDDNDTAWIIYAHSDHPSRFSTLNPYNGYSEIDTGITGSTDDGLNKINELVWNWISRTNYGKI